MLNLTTFRLDREMHALHAQWQRTQQLRERAKKAEDEFDAEVARMTLKLKAFEQEIDLMNRYNQERGAVQRQLLEGSAPSQDRRYIGPTVTSPKPGPKTSLLPPPVSPSAMLTLARALPSPPLSPRSPSPAIHEVSTESSASLDLKLDEEERKRLDIARAAGARLCSDVASEENHQQFVALRFFRRGKKWSSFASSFAGSQK